MRVQLWCDMEGVAGITQWAQVNGGAPQYPQGQRLYTSEINAAVRGCKRAGATEIVVIDGHGAGGEWSFNSWIFDELEPGAEYITGYRWGSYVAGLQSGIDAVLLPGAHARAGSLNGVLSHTISNTKWVNASINGTKVGESGFVAAIAGSFDTPVVFASGDDVTCEEVRDLIGPKVVTACVKKGLSRFAARNLSHKDSCDLIEESVLKALTNRDWPAPLKMDPAELRIELHSPDQAENYVGKPGVEVIDPRTLVVRADTFWELWDKFWPR